MKFKSSGSLGDIIYSIPCALDMARRAGEPIDFYLQPGVPGGWAKSILHPAGKFRMSEQLARAMIPLLVAQPAFRHVGLWDGQPVDVDLDLMRQSGIDFRAGHIPRYFFNAFLAHADLSKPWLFVEPATGYEDRIVVNRTSRYRNPRIDYRFLDAHKPVFVGLEDEFEDFRRQVPSAEYAPTADFLALASVVAGCKLFVGNQSSAFAVAEGLGVVRLLEVSSLAPNVVPTTCGNGRDAVSQMAFEAHFNEMMG
jgi:hypothetical protein